ncbi:unnamed protein product, partial [Brassica rapa subsp. trilocularis]
IVVYLSLSLSSGADGSRCSGEGLRGTLLLNLRHQPRRSSRSLPGGFHAHLRGPEDPRSPEHRRQAHLSPLPAVQAQYLHCRLPAFWSRLRYARFRLRQPPARRRGARPQVQPDVSLDADSTRKLLRVQRYLQAQLLLITLLLHSYLSNPFIISLSICLFFFLHSYMICLENRGKNSLSLCLVWFGHFPFTIYWLDQTL